MKPEERRAIEWDCAHLLARFYRHLDERAYRETADLFLKDGEWLRMGELLSGKDKILSVIEQRSRSMAIRHLLSNVVVDVDGADAATVRAYVTVFIHRGGAAMALPATLEQPVAIWTLRVRCVPIGGAWKIQSHRGERVMVRADVAPLQG